MCYNLFIITSRKYMVNTVGSYATKYWYRDLIPVKERMFLTDEQYSVIVGSLLGDGTMRIGKGARNANLKIEQGLAQKEYTEYKYSVLKNLVLTEPKISSRYDSNRRKYPKSWWFRTVRHPFLTKIYKRFYTGNGYLTGKKIIPEDIICDLNPQSLAIWIMDDGSYNKGIIDISTYSFTLIEVKILEKAIFEKFGIQMVHHKDRDKGFRMYANKSETSKIVDLIRPYIIYPMEYKIGCTAP